MSTITLVNESGQRERIIRRLTHLARLMDVQFRLPGTRFRFGLDGLIGLIPGAGDVIGAAISVYIILEARRLGASKWIMARMIGNVLLELVIGAIPLLGDIFDIIFKANVRNLRMLGIDVSLQEGRR
jgi:hypothetical protein